MLQILRESLKKFKSITIENIFYIVDILNKMYKTMLFKLQV